MARSALLFVVVGLVVSCGGRQVSGPGESPGPATGTGTIAFALTMPPGVELDTVGYQLVNAAGATAQAGTISIQTAQSIQFQLSNVPPGAGYTITLSSTGTGGVSCSGSAGPFTVVARATTMVQVGLACYAPGADAGNVLVNGTPFLCGTWNSLSTVGSGGQVTNGSEANVGSAITLTATATGPDPAALTYSWSSSNPIGTFGPNDASGTSDTTTFVCTAPGTTTITMVVGDGPVPAGQSCAAGQSTVTTVVTCDEPPAAFNRVTFTIATGAASLQRKDAATVTLQPGSGTPQTFTVKPSGDPDWKAHTTHTASFLLNPTLGICDVANAVIGFVPGNADAAVATGTWEVTSLVATLSVDGADQATIVQAAGAPLALLTGAQRSFPTAATCSPGPSLFDRLGGDVAMAAIATDFVSRVTTDARLSRILSNVLSTPAKVSAATTWLTAEMCRLGGGGCSPTGGSPFAGINPTTDEEVALINDLTASAGRFPAPATLADENQLLGVPLAVAQDPLPPLVANDRAADPTAAVGGGIAAPEFVNVYWDATWDADNGGFSREALDSLGNAVAGSSYFGELFEYGVGNSVFLGSFLPSSACTQHAPSSVGFYDPFAPSIIGFLQCELDNDSSLPQGENVIYNVILPKGSTEVDSIAKLLGVPPDCHGGALSWHFHGSPYAPGVFIGGLLGSLVGTSVGSPELGSLGGLFVGLTTQGGPFYTISSADPSCGTYTDNLLHEDVEAASDPAPGLGVLLSGGTGEIGDLCTPPVTSFAPPSSSWEPPVATFGLPVSVPQYWSNLGQACETGFLSSVHPFIGFVSIAGAFPSTSITISGSGFGTLPPAFPVPSGVDLPYIGVQDSTRSWRAGNSLNSDAMPLAITSWTDSTIVISGFSPPSGSTITAGDNDNVLLWVCNPSSGNCTSATTTFPTGTGGGGPNPHDILSIDVTFETGDDSARPDTELQMRVDSQSTVCLKPSNNASPDSVCANGGSATDQNGNQEWSADTVNGTQTFVLSSPTPIASAMTVTLISHNNGTEEDDNWDIQAVHVVANLRIGTSTVLLDIPAASGSPNSDNCIARLKGQPNATAVTFTLDGLASHTYANGNELGLTTTCKNNGDQ